MKLTRGILWTTILCLLLGACQLIPPPTSLPAGQGASRANLPAQASLQQAWLAKYRAKKPYLGPVQVHLDQTLLAVQNGALKQDLTDLLNGQGYQIQSLPAGPVAFQETFVVSPQKNEFRQEFRVTDTNLRYVVHVERRGQLGETDVLLNGSRLLQNRDFAHATEAQSQGLLLQPNNSLLVRLHGKPGATVTVTVLQAGESGTVLRRQGKLGLPGETQATHVRRGDINLFDPNDPTSLGGLEPYQGDLFVPAAGSFPALRVSGLQINDLPPLRFESGVLMLKFADPAIGLEVLRNQYGAELLGELDDYYSLRVNLRTAPIDRIVDLIHGFNQHSDGNVESITFSSLAAMQTYAIGLDLLLRFPGLLTSFDFNQIGEPSATFNDSVLIQDQNTTVPDPTDPSKQIGGIVNVPLKDCGGNFAESWWLTQTHTDKAWDLSIGTGVKVAWLDVGFSSPTIDLDQRRQKFGLGDLNKDQFDTFPDGGSSDLGKHHAFYAMMTGFAERDNGIGMTGVAPNATVVPYRVWSSRDFAYAINQARTHDIKVIGINYGWRKSMGFQSFFYTLLEGIAFGGNGSLRTQITDALAENRTVVMSAHNYHESIENWVMADLTVGDHSKADDYDPKLENLIVVGSVMPFKPDGVSQPTCPEPGPGQLQVYANYRQELQGQNGAGSNYGPDMVWAPGDQIYTYNRLFGDSGQPPLTHWGDTSAATPFVTAVVALMKSRNPALTPADVKRILLASKAQPIVPNPGMQSASLTAHLLNVEQAVQQAKAGSPVAQEYSGRVNSAGSGRQLTFNKSVVRAPGITIPEDEKRLDLPFQTVANPVWNGPLNLNQMVKVRGWRAISAGETPFAAHQIEVLNAEPISGTPVLNGITQGTTPPNSKTEFELLLTGSDLFANLQSSPGSRLKLIFKNIAPTASDNPETTIEYTDVTPSPSPASTPTPSASPSPASKPPAYQTVGLESLLDASNTGSSFTVKVPAKALTRGDYQIAFEGAGGRSAFFPGGSSFSVASEGSDSGSDSFHVASLAESPPPEPNPHINLWVVRGTQRLAVKPEYVVGVAINDQDLSQLQVEIVQGDTTIQANVVEVAQNFAAFKIPVGAQAGVKDLLLKIGAQQVLMEDALELQPADAVSVQFDQPSVYISDRANVTIKVRKPDGTTYPDGTPIYVVTTSPGLPHGLTAYTEDGAITGAGRVLPLQNGEVRYKIAAETHIPPGAYHDGNWPDWRAGHPHAVVRDVCLGHYGYSGWGCGTRLGPSNPEDEQPRLYFRDAYWVEGPYDMPVYSGGGGYSTTLHFFDRAGIPVPDGTTIYNGQTYWGGFNHAGVTTGNALEVTAISNATSCWGWGSIFGDPPVREGLALRSNYSQYPQTGDYFRNLNGGIYAMTVVYLRAPGCPLE